MAVTPPPEISIPPGAFRPVPTFSAEPRAQTAKATPRAVSDRSRASIPRTLAGAPPPMVEQPEAQALVVRPKSVSQPVIDGRILGKASWYCLPGRSVCTKGYPASGLYAAAGPRLRAALCGSQASNCWRGKTVRVNGIPVKLIDWCQCYWKQPHEKLLDLYHGVFEKTGGDVVVVW